MIKRMCISQLGRRDPGCNCVLCKSTDVTTRHIRLSGRLVNLATLVCDVNQWSVVEFRSAFCNYWFDLLWEVSRYTLLMRPKKLSSGSVCRTQCLQDFLVVVISTYNIISLLKKEDIRIELSW